MACCRERVPFSQISFPSETPTVTNAIPIQQAWKFCPRCGASASQAGQHPFRCSDDICGYTHYFSPNTAVGALIVDDRGAMLFIVRGKDPGKGKLGLPGGFVDAGETAEQSLVRELEEELNLAVTRYEYLASFPNEYAFCGVVTPVTDLFYIARVATLQGMKAQEGEVDGWKFIPSGEVNPEDLAFETHRLALDVFRSQHS